MKQPDPKYVSADRPVNRRTTPKVAAPPPPLPPVVATRLATRVATLQAQNRFGVPLAEQLRARPKSRAHPRLLVAGGAVTASSAIGLFLATLKSLPLAASGAGLGMVLGFGLLYLARKPRATETGDADVMPALFSEVHLQAFDRALAQVAPEIPEAVAARLAELKGQLLRIAQLADGVGSNEHFTLDDRHYLTECLRRYLPDSLQSYLQVAPGARDSPILEAKQSATDLLLQQIGLLQIELAKRETALNQSAAAQLVRQQRFLESKTRR
jgi:hypothetical protein